MAHFRRAHQRLLQDKSALIAQYPNRWLAVGEYGVIDTAPTPSELADKLNAAAAEFLPTEPKALIL